MRARARSRVAARPAGELVAALAVPLDEDLVTLALTHRSYAYENGGLPTNERLEFLGDAVLGLVVTDALYRRYPDNPEGQLAKLRASVVNMRALADVARGIGSDGSYGSDGVLGTGISTGTDAGTGGLGGWLLLGRGEESTGGRDKPSILADTLEAVIGAAYLSAGIDVATRLVLDLVGPLLDRQTPEGHGRDHKTALQELAAARLLGPPEYAVTEHGPDHAKVFSANALLGGEALGDGSGGSKKEAEQAAAAAAYEALSARARSAGPASELASEPELASEAEPASEPELASESE